MGWKRNKILKSQKGLASIEATVLIVLFIALFYYSFGFFGIVHTAILHNIHARTYVFETLRHRANLFYFRSNRPTLFHYYFTQTRLHGINLDSPKTQNDQVATERPISYGKRKEELGRENRVHNSEIFERIPATSRNRDVDVNPAWIMVLYGICLNSSCGKN